MFAMNQEDIQKVTDRLRRLCSRREYCVSDVMKKAVTALEGDSEAAGKVVAILIAEKYVDDLRYATAYAREKAMISGWGETKIRYMLSAKGISRDTIAEALKSIDEDKASGRLEKLMESKARSLKGDPQFKLKMLRFGVGRGYAYEAVVRVTDRIIELWKDSED